MTGEPYCHNATELPSTSALQAWPPREQTTAVVLHARSLWHRAHARESVRVHCAAVYCCRLVASGFGRRWLRRQVCLQQ